MWLYQQQQPPLFKHVFGLSNGYAWVMVKLTTLTRETKCTRSNDSTRIHLR